MELVEKLRACFFVCSWRGYARSRLGGAKYFASNDLNLNRVFSFIVNINDRLSAATRISAAALLQINASPPINHSSIIYGTWPVARQIYHDKWKRKQEKRGLVWDTNMGVVLLVSGTPILWTWLQLLKVPEGCLFKQPLASRRAKHRTVTP